MNTNVCETSMKNIQQGGGIGLVVLINQDWWTVHILKATKIEPVWEGCRWCNQRNRCGKYRGVTNKCSLYI